ncbi:hypothetical protein Hdeb2414_s0066g00767971 [Helianthus debilis subsp. tardiflorus]
MQNLKKVLMKSQQNHKLQNRMLMRRWLMLHQQRKRLVVCSSCFV